MKRALEIAAILGVEMMLIAAAAFAGWNLKAAPVVEAVSPVYIEVPYEVRIETEKPVFIDRPVIQEVVRYEPLRDFVSVGELDAFVESYKP